MLKKALSVILVLVMVLTALPLTAVFSFAAEKSESISFEFDLSEADVDILSFSETEKPSYSFNGTGSFNFYSYLDSFQKNIYNLILAEKAGLNAAKASATQSTDTSATVTFSLTISKDQWNEYWNGGKLKTAVTMASRALAYDYPEFFWMGAFNTNLSAQDTGTVWNVTVKYTVNLKTDSYPNWSVVIDYYNKLLDAVNTFKVEGATRYEKVKSIHDSICKKVSYDEDFNNPIAHEPISVFIAPFEPVCEGYAEAFKLICDREEIPCICVTGDAGGDHAWNYVKMENGVWYAVDVTWDDQSTIRYDYFLVGLDTVVTSDGLTLSQNHTPSEIYGLFTYPEISNQRYLCDAKNGWIKEDDHWSYYVNDVAKTGWLNDEGKWYLFDDNGIMQTDWKKINGNWFYFGGSDSGVMRTGWQKVSGKWYYFGGANDGVMKNGWQKLGGKWYYFGGADDGVMKTGWQKLGKNWYYFGGADDGVMKAGWQKISNKWYYFGGADDGVMKTGWQKISGKWYYFGGADDGVMKTGWVKSNGKWYYMDVNGAMIYSCSKTINGKTYKFDSNGICTNP